MIARFNDLKERHPFIPQFIRFFCVGLLNTGIDFGVLNFLIFLTGKTSGIYFPIFKSISFIIAITNSYFMNKHWTFKSLDNKSAGEFLKFFGVNIVGWSINVGVSTYVVNFVAAPSGFSPVLWANIGAVSAVIFTLTWNFIGMKFIVFKK
ncbi:MAG: GtrA family protein [Minisyncoccota bacterium]